MTYAVNHVQVGYSTSRRGIYARAPIDLDGKRIGTLDDDPVKIIANVEFVSLDAKVAFTAAAKQAMPVIWGRDDHPDHVYVSEYARKLLSDAEEKALRAEA